MNKAILPFQSRVGSQGARIVDISTAGPLPSRERTDMPTLVTPAPPMQTFPSRRFSRVLGSAVFVLAAMLGLGVPSASHAQWVIIPIGDEASARGLLAQTQAATAESGIEAASDAAATELFESEVSAPAQPLSQTDIDQWASRSRSALRALARADYAAARADLLEAQRLAEHAAEELNREAERARQVLDTCLFMTRTLLETGDAAEALRQVRMCRVLVPELAPQEHFHPPEVHEILARVDAEPHTGTLRITSNPSGCIARLNGIAQQETPLDIEGLGRGSYRLQVECDERRGRVHRVEIVGDTSELVHVDLGLDEVVRSRPFVHLRTPVEINTHARVLAQDLGRTSLFVQSISGQLLLTRVTPAGDISRARTTPENLAPALSALREGRSMDFTGASPRSLDEPNVAAGTPETASSGVPSWRLAVGIGSAVVGVGVLATSAFLLRSRTVRGEQFAIAEPTDADYLMRQERYLERRSQNTAITALALGGGAVAGFGIALLIPPSESAWWSWVVGGAGLALGGVGAALWLSRDDCSNLISVDVAERNACVSHDQRGPLAAILVGASLPLIAVPVSSLLQRGGADAHASVSPAMTDGPGGPRLSGARFTIEGTF